MKMKTKPDLKDFKIIKIERCWFSPWHVYAIFKCQKDCSIESIVLDRVVFAKEGQYIRLRINKRHCPIKGRQVNIDYLLPEAINQNAIDWYWNFEDSKTNEF